MNKTTLNNETETLFLIDQLSNSMENFYSKNQFIKHISGQTNFSPKFIEKVWDMYWGINAKDRLKFSTDEWITAINNLI